MKILKILKRTYFTLLEMVVSLGVFMVLLVIVLNFYDSVFSTASLSSRTSLLFDNANTAMDIIARDLQCIYYKNDAVPFWHKGPTPWTGDDKQYNNDLIAFVSATDLPSEAGNSRLCEVKYQLYFPDSGQGGMEADSAGWILRSTTGDLTSIGGPEPKWNFNYNVSAGKSGPGNAFTANIDSSDTWQKLIPGVTDLTFECFDINGTVIVASAVDPTFFPYSIEINLSLMDKDSWQKWIAILGPTEREIFRKNHIRTFYRTVFIGERGQGE